MAHAERRMREALDRFGAWAADTAMEDVARRGKQVKGIDYDQLEMIDAGSAAGTRVVAIVLPSSAMELDEDEKTSTAVYVIPRSSTPDRPLEMLAELSPWPAAAMPFVPDKTDARLVSRAVSEQEYRARVDQMIDDKDSRETLAKLGLVGKTVPRSVAVRKLLSRRLLKSIEVEEDLAWKALRVEFGIGDEPHVQHWRPALKKAAGPPEKMLEAMVEFLHGDERALEKYALAYARGEVTESAERFQDMLGNAT